MGRIHAVTAAVGFFLAAQAAQAATVTLDNTVQYQTIEGFGAHGAMDVWWNAGPFFSPAWLDLVIDDLGLTMVRNEYAPPTDTSYTFAKQAPYLQAIKAKAAASGQPLKFIATYWSPPAAWKSNGDRTNGGYLLPEHYADLGNYAVQTARQYDSIGVGLYGLSLQNEPAFTEPYSSCVYTPAQYRDMVKVAGPIVHTSYPNLKLFGSENMLPNWGTFEGPLVADTASKAQMGALAVHDYTGSPSVTLWSRAAGNAGTAGKALWMTETAIDDTTWNRAYWLAQSIYSALKTGRVTAWLYWQLGYSGTAWAGYYLIQNTDHPTALYYACKQFFRYIRPGATQIRSTCDDAQVYVVAFQDVAAGTATVVAINTANAAKTLALTGSPTPATLAGYRSSATERCVSLGALPTGAIALPAQSVTTLVGGSIPPSTIALLSPNGGEVWEAASVHDITWTSSGTVSQVAIEYSMNGGATWSTVVSSTPNDGSYAWTVPNAPTTDCRVRVSDAADGVPADTSNASFTIDAVTGVRLPGPAASGIVGIGPNPVRGTLTVRFALAQRADVLLRVYSASGALVRSLASGPTDAGYHQFVWDGRSSVGSAVPHGLYIVRAVVGGKATDMMVTVVR